MDFFFKYVRIFGRVLKEICMKSGTIFGEQIGLRFGIITKKTVILLAESQQNHVLLLL